jgi:hypothetical protein
MILGFHRELEDKYTETSVSNTTQLRNNPEERSSQLRASSI